MNSTMIKTSLCSSTSFCKKRKKQKDPNKNRTPNLAERILRSRSIYFIGSIAFVGGCLYQTLSFLQFYLDYPTAMEVSVEQQPILMFPAVTVCSGNRVRKSVWCSVDNSTCKSKVEETEEDFALRLQKTYRLLNKTTRIALGHTKSSFIQSCLFEGASCENIEQFYHPDYTNCFTVNARWGNKSKKPLSAVMFNPRSGKPSDLWLLLNLEKEEYTTELNEIVRAKMTIHSPDAIPNPEYDGESLLPGLNYNYAIREDCFSECSARLFLKYCACTENKFSFVHDIKSCQESNENKCLDYFDSQVKDFCRNECRMPCMKTTYKYETVDSYNLPKAVFDRNNESIRTLTETDRQNLLALRVYYVSPDSEVYTHRPMFNGIQLFSVIGGYIGLWLGVSLLDIFGYLLNYAFLCTIKKRKIVNNNNMHSTINISKCTNIC